MTRLDAAHEANRRSTRQRVASQVRADVEEHLTADGLIPLQVAIAVVLKHRKAGYARGFGAAYQRHRRHAAQVHVPRGTSKE